MLWYAGGRFREPRLIGWMEGAGELDTGQHDNARQVDYAVGCCMLIHRRVFERIGLLDERFFFFQEDVDFSVRARQAGFEVWYQPHSVIRHKVSQSTRDDLALRGYLDAQSRMVFFRSHIRGGRIPAVLFWEFGRLTRITFMAARAGQLKLAHHYLRGLAAGWRAANQPPVRS
jgi:GT2 family glycosyltransferase